MCPILRAGLGMLDGVLTLISGARVGFIGLYRDEETLQPVEYYVKLPQDVADRDVILLDPMLATGNSTAHAVKLVKDAGASSVRLISIIAAPEGIANIEAAYPDVQIVVAAIDRQLNERGYIVPGPRRRGRPSLRHEVGFDDGLGELTDHLEVLWGALAALGIVLLLTPVVGSCARGTSAGRAPDGGDVRGTRSRGSAVSRSSSASSCRRSRSCRSAASCAASCSAPASRRSSARSTTSAGSTGGRSSAVRSWPRRSPRRSASGCSSSRSRSSASTPCRRGSACR